MGRTWQMSPFAWAPNTIPRGPVPRSRTALRAGGEGRYLCRPVIAAPQDGPAGEDCGLVAVAASVGAELFARDGAKVCEQAEPANTITTSAQPRPLNRVSGDRRGMSSLPPGVPSARGDACESAASSTGGGHAEDAATQEN